MPNNLASMSLSPAAAFVSAIVRNPTAPNPPANRSSQGCISECLSRSSRETFLATPINPPKIVQAKILARCHLFVLSRPPCPAGGQMAVFPAEGVHEDRVSRRGSCGRNKLRVSHRHPKFDAKLRRILASTIWRNDARRFRKLPELPCPTGQTTCSTGLSVTFCVQPALRSTSSSRATLCMLMSKEDLARRLGRQRADLGHWSSARLVQFRFHLIWLRPVPDVPAFLC